LILIVFISADNIATSSNKFFTFSYLTLVLALIYGSFQAAGFDFFEYALNYKGIRLTFANPNFSSAFLGIMAMIPLSFLFSGNLKLKILHASTYFWTIYLIFQTQSSQGFVLVVLGTILYLILYFFDKESINMVIVASFSIVTMLFLSVVLYLSNILTRLEQSFQIFGRLEHWRISFAIWNDHRLFGVGIENLGKYSGQYLSEDSSAAWGGYVYPDKAHNGILEHFTNGGLIVGISWLIFIILISYSAIKIQKTNSNRISKERARTLACMWFAYLGQNLISTDQIVLAVIGMFVAGAIIGLRFTNTSRQNG
jgi:O-antigen ligase